MPRAVKDAKLDSRTARAKLAPRGKPYWRALDHELHLGYRKSAQFGRWVARRYVGQQQYLTATIGTADDNIGADGVAVLDWRQAQDKAREWRATAERAAAGIEAAAPLTIADVVNEYLDWITKHRKPTTAREWRYMAGRTSCPRSASSRSPSSPRRLRRWHEDLAEQPARLRTRRARSSAIASRTATPIPSAPGAPPRTAT